jgi:hypothetical protein
MALSGKEASMITRMLLALMALLVLTHCNDTVEKEREVGYRGKARINPYLAFERFVQQHLGEEVVIQHTWPELDGSQSMLIFSADLLSSQLSVDQIKEWISDGGHAVFLFDNADMHRSDWAEYNPSPEVPQVLMDFLAEMDLKIEDESSEEKYTKVEIYDEEFQVDLSSYVRLIDEKNTPQAVICREYGDGLVTFVSDARLMRNREIDQEQHIELITYLLQWRRDGEIVFMRGVGISFFSLLWQKAWMVLLALAVLIGAWLLRHMPRFGPLQGGLREDQIRAYDHHLEMIGDFHWRLDRGSSLLHPLRMELQEMCHQWQSKHGRLDEGLFEVMATRADLPLERIERAMTELQPRDNLIFTRTVADLQHIRKAFA